MCASGHDNSDKMLSVSRAEVGPWALGECHQFDSHTFVLRMETAKTRDNGAPRVPARCRMWWNFTPHTMTPTRARTTWHSILFESGWISESLIPNCFLTHSVILCVPNIFMCVCVLSTWRWTFLAHQSIINSFRQRISNRHTLQLQNFIRRHYDISFLFHFQLSIVFVWIQLSIVWLTHTHTHCHGIHCLGGVRSHTNFFFE